MCGIAGWLDNEIDLREKTGILKNMSQSLALRGPDENATEVYQECAMIHRRLVVIDKENGKQPMTAVFGDKKYVIVYNGELYNTEDLRTELKHKGFKFKGHSDTEVVLLSYVYWGKKCVHKLNGIFAFCIYELHSKKLFMCRDRIGVKPLFYYQENNRLLFASEIKALLKSGVVKPVIDEKGLYEIFFLGPARTCGNGIFKGVNELAPGEIAVYHKGKLTKEKYFKLTAKPHTDNEQETIEKTRYLLTDAIKRQLITDVPMCFFLSGGLDSSIICKVAADYHRENNLANISTYSVEYKGNDRYFKKSDFQPNQDVEFINSMVKSIGSEHTQILLDNRDLFNALFKSVNARDLPGMADVDSSLLLFCGEIKKDYTVALSGECADELFGGYPWYHNKNILFEQCFPWSRSQQIRRSILKDGILKRGEDYVYQRYLDTVKSTDKLQGDSVVEGRMREMFVLNFYWFMQCLLERKDRCSMYNGLEVRVPFCDYRIVEYAYNMPWKLKAYNGREKGIIRKAFENILPNEICWRKKSPYPKTHNPVYMQLCSSRVREILNRKGSVINELISKDGIYDIIRNPDNISSPWYGQLMRAPQILAYIIELDYWFEKYNVDIEYS